MGRLLGKWLNVYEEETALFLWAAVLLFIIHVGNVLFTNTAETAFLKRYGVQYLPIMYMINAVATFFIMGVLTGIMARMSDSRLLSYMLVGSGTLVGILRFAIPLGYDLIYPVLFLLKSQLEVLLALVFWNMANDLFTTRQSKRIFPLITAGGVIGAILGSFATSPLAKLIAVDNLLLAYFALSLVAAVVVQRMGHLYPTLLVRDQSGEKKGKGRSRTNIVQEFRKILPLIKTSTLVQVLIALSLMANIVITIINYQFNFAVNQSYATEGGMIKFFAVFRGFLNTISLVILLFVGKLYGKWGIPVALLIHPFNYVIAFLALLFRFDIYSAMYARISTNVLRTTINTPAMAVLMGLFHSSQRAVVRPFLRGTVVRIGTLIGSGLILFLGGLFHPRYLSIIALICMGVWLTYDFILKRHYSRILVNLISQNMIDLKSLELGEAVLVFRDKKVQKQLLELFLVARGKDCLWYGALLKDQHVAGFDDAVLTVFKRENEATRIGLLDFLSPLAGEAAISVFGDLAGSAGPRLVLAMAKTVNQFPPHVSREWNMANFGSFSSPEIKGYALAGLYHGDPDKYLDVIRLLFGSKIPEDRQTGVFAAGESGNGTFVRRLREMLIIEKEIDILCALFRSLGQLQDPQRNEVLFSHLSHPSEGVRLAALEAYHIQDDQALSRVIILMGDPAPEIRTKAVQMILNSEYQNPLVLVESLTFPMQKVRRSLFQILEKLNIKDLDVFRFARLQVEKSYECLAISDALGRLPKSSQRDILVNHLEEQKMINVENVLRVLSIQDESGRMRVLWRGLSSLDSRQRANSIEALANVIDAALARILVPLLDEMPAQDRLKIGKRHFSLPDPDQSDGALFSHLLAKGDWVTTLLTLSLMATKGPADLTPDFLTPFTESDNPHIRRMAMAVQRTWAGEGVEAEVKAVQGMDLSERIFQLITITVFEGLQVSELAAIGSMVEEVSYSAGVGIFREGEPGDALYLVVEGEVSVCKAKSGERDPGLEIGRIGSGEYFGEMAILEEAPRSASIQTVTPARFLVLQKRDFIEIVQEYPQIALHICKVLSSRLRKLQQKIKDLEKTV